jgi:predicted HTH domain antitoxin
MKLEIEVDVADDIADKTELQEHLRKEAILSLFADRKITAGKAAHELGMERLAFMELLHRRGIPDVVYTAEDWEADATAIREFERRRKVG